MIDMATAQQEIECRCVGRPRFRRRFLGAPKWLVPSIALAFVPKCPACLAAYIAIGTGWGVSVTTATHVRQALVVLCAASLVFLVTKRLRALAHLKHIHRKVLGAGT